MRLSECVCVRERERERERLGYQLFNRVGRFNPRNSQMLKFSRGNHVETHPALWPLVRRNVPSVRLLRQSATIPGVAGVQNTRSSNTWLRIVPEESRRLRESPPENRSGNSDLSSLDYIRQVEKRRLRSCRCEKSAKAYVSLYQALYV